MQHKELRIIFVIKPKELIYNFSPISYSFFRNNPNDKSPIKYTHLMVVEKSTTGGLTNMLYIFCFCIKRSLGLFMRFFFFILHRRMEMGHHQEMEVGHHQDLSRDQRNY